MADQWFIAKGKQKLGPLSSAQLKDYAITGNIQPTDMVLKAGTQQWRPARDIKGLFSQAPNAARPVKHTTPPFEDISAQKRTSPRSKPKSRLWLWLSAAGGSALVLAALALFAFRGNENKLPVPPGNANENPTVAKAGNGKMPDFSNLDYSIPKVDYSKGPKGEKIEELIDDLRPTDRIEGFFDAKDKPVLHGKTLEFYQGGKQRKSEQLWFDGKLHGARTDWFPNGNKEWEGTYSKGEKHGKWMKYYENGKVAAENWWLNGKMHGLVVSFYDNGVKAAVGAFKNDKHIGKWQRWNEDGKQMSADESLREDLELVGFDEMIDLLGQPTEVHDRKKVKTKQSMYVWRTAGERFIAIAVFAQGNSMKKGDILEFQVDRSKIDRLMAVWGLK